MKKYKQSHSTNKKIGMGDMYGTGEKNPVGKMKSDSVGIRPASKKGLKIPPKKLA
jgi:hypothetical protein